MAQYKNIDIVPDETITRVHLSQGDIGRTLIFYLFENALSWSVPSNSTIKCQGTKHSGFGFSVSCTYSGNVVTCVTTEEMTDEYGQIEAELVITSSDESQVFGTSNFILDIERNPHPDGTVDGDAENPVIANLNAVITQAVDSWLDEHPEATTTVQDGSITEPKFASALALKTINEYVTPELYGAVGDGVADDTNAIQSAVDSGKPCFLTKTYGITSTIVLPSNATLFGAGRGSCCIKYIGNATSNPMIAIPYTSYFCSAHDLTVDGNGKAPAIYDCYNKPAGTFVGIRTQLYNLNLMQYTDYGIYLDGMGSELYNCYVTGTISYSKYGIYVVGTDNRIRDCRLQLNNLYGLYVIGSNNVLSAVKCSVNEKGAYLKGGFLDCELECQENRSNGIDINTMLYSTVKLSLTANCYANANGYGAYIKSSHNNNIEVTGRKHSVLGDGNTGQEKSMLYLDETSYDNNIDACMQSQTSNDYLYIDGFSAHNNIVMNGSKYDNFDILTSQGFTPLNKVSTYSNLSGASSVTFNANFDYADITLTNTSGTVNMFSLNNSDLSQYSKIIVIVETDGYSNSISNYMKINFPILYTTNSTTISPTNHYDTLSTRYIISVFETTTNANKIYFRTSGSNNCANARNGLKFQVFAKA